MSETRLFPWKPPTLAEYHGYDDETMPQAVSTPPDAVLVDFDPEAVPVFLQQAAALAFENTPFGNRLFQAPADWQDRDDLHGLRRLTRLAFLVRTAPGGSFVRDTDLQLPADRTHHLADKIILHAHHEAPGQHDQYVTISAPLCLLGAYDDVFGGQALAEVRPVFANDCPRPTLEGLAELYVRCFHYFDDETAAFADYAVSRRGFLKEAAMAADTHLRDRPSPDPTRRAFLEQLIAQSLYWLLPASAGLRIDVSGNTIAAHVPVPTKDPGQTL